MDLPITQTHVKRIEQWTIEDTYSRANVRKHVKKVVLDMIEDDQMAIIFQNITNRVLEWQLGDYYKSKNARRDFIQDLTIDNIALDIVISVLPVTRKSPIQSIATRLAKQLGFTDVFDGIRTASELLGACAKTGLYQMWLNPITLQCQVEMPQGLINYINKTQYLNPMVCSPMPWIDNSNGGYISVCQSAILGRQNHHLKKQGLDALNIAQEVEWELDMQMVNYIEKPKNECISNQQIEGHIRQTNSALDVYQDLVNQGNEFFFVWRFDFRGRMYTQGYFVNLQSTDYKKSILNFTQKKVISEDRNEDGFSGLDYTKIAVANAYGLDKQCWDDRILWVDNHSHELGNYTGSADEPFMYTKACHALEAEIRNEETGFIMGLDATASGLQLMACLTGCIDTARNTNLIDTGQRMDIYGLVADEMNKLGISKVSRAQVKHPVMTTFYGSTAQPRDLFGEGTRELQAFYQVLHRELPGAMKLMTIMQSYWDPLAIKHQWSLPDGHVVIAPVYQKVDKKIEVDELNHATFTHRADVIMPADNGLSLAANIIHSIDGYVVREMYRGTADVGIQMAAIHDSFWCHPNDMGVLRELYRSILADIAGSHLISHILYEISGKKVNYLKKSQNLPDLILKSEYALS